MSAVIAQTCVKESPMKITLRFAFLLTSAITLLSTTALTAEASCGSISDSDARALCRAKESKNSGQCSSIRDSDKRAYCRAITGSGSGQCSSIRDSNLRNQCRAEAR